MKTSQTNSFKDFDFEEGGPDTNNRYTHAKVTNRYLKGNKNQDDGFVPILELLEDPASLKIRLDAIIRDEASLAEKMDLLKLFRRLNVRPIDTNKNRERLILLCNNYGINAEHVMRHYMMGKGSVAIGMRSRKKHYGLNTENKDQLHTDRVREALVSGLIFTQMQKMHLASPNAEGLFFQASKAGTYKAEMAADFLQGVEKNHVLWDMRGTKKLGLLLSYAMDFGLYNWIRESEERHAVARTWLTMLAPVDPSFKENDGSNNNENGGRGVDGNVADYMTYKLAGEQAREVDPAFTHPQWWDEKYDYDVIIVTGVTPRPGTDPKKNRKLARKGKDLSVLMEGRFKEDQQSPNTNYLKGEAVERLRQAVQDFDDKRAPFILVSGSNVWPKGTNTYEAILMKNWLIEQRPDLEDRIIVDAKARHSTSNLRNAGRYMLDNKMKVALVTTTGAQDFWYFSHPNSIFGGFNKRAKKEMGVSFDNLKNISLHKKDDHHSVFTPSQDLQKLGILDPFDM